MNQSPILIAEMSDADGVQIRVKMRAEHGLEQTKHVFIRSIRAISKRDKAPAVSMDRRNTGVQNMGRGLPVQSRPRVQLPGHSI
jgi:hypothetical protein